MRVIIFVDGFHASDTRYNLFESAPPRSLLPVAGSPFLAMQVARLRHSGVSRFLLLSDRSPELARILMEPVLQGLDWGVVYPGRSLAGTLRKLGVGQDSPCLILDGTVCFSARDLDRAREHVLSGKAAAVCLQDPASEGSAWLVAPGLSLPHSGRRDLGSLLMGLGQREPLPCIKARDPVWCMGTLAQYHHMLLDLASMVHRPPGHCQYRPGIYLGAGVSIPDSVLDAAIGPVIIGAGCRIGRGVELEGPLELGADVQVGENSSLKRSIILPNTRVGAGVDIHDKVVARDLLWSASTDFLTRIEDPELLAPYFPESLSDKLLSSLGRGVDIIASGTALLAFSPLFLLVAGLIKISSPGPVFYVGERVVRPARRIRNDRVYIYEDAVKIPYPVFRTMRVGADKEKVEETGSNVYQAGPYKKFVNDPRITSVGHILRKTSIDELPLLWNVFRGRMSLVGLWALPADEARALAEEDISLGDAPFSSVARLRFGGRPGLAGFWQSRGRSRLSAEARAMHDAFQASIMDSPGHKDYLSGEYRRYRGVLGRVRVFMETLSSATVGRGAM